MFGTAEGEWWYYPYGEKRHKQGQLHTNKRYTGQRWDSGAGLYWYRSRWYDPTIGRFAQPDTIVPDPGDPQSLNRYSSVLNNPLRYIDPSGHCIVQYSGDVRMDEYPYGTSGLCANTESVIAEGNAAIEEYHNDPDIATSTEELLFWYIGGPAALVGASEVAAAIPALIELLFRQGVR